MRPRTSTLNERIRTLALALAGILMTATTASADVQVVDCQNGPFFEIGPAIDAASRGDTVLVQPCDEPYLPFIVGGRRDLHIVGNGGAQLFPTGQPQLDFRPPVRIARLPGQVPLGCVEIGQSIDITVTGFTFEDCPFRGADIRDSRDISILANRFEGGVEGITDLFSNGSRIDSNLIVGSGQGITVTGPNVVVSQNVILDTDTFGIGILSAVQREQEVIGNAIIRSGGSSIVVSADDVRVERNVCLESGSPVGSIVLQGDASGAIVVGNVTDGAISDSGVDNTVIPN